MMKLLLVVAAACGSAAAPSATAQCFPVGFDRLLIGDIGSAANYAAIGGRDAVMFGVTWCNNDSAPTPFDSGSNQHPIVMQNLYRLSLVDGTEQVDHIGMSWAFHAVVPPLQQQLCCTSCTPAGGINLGVWCSSPDSASTVGTQSLLGPRSDISPITFAYPFPPANPPTTDGHSRRLQFALSDVDPSVNPSRFFVEAVALTQGGFPVSSYREVNVAGSPTDRTLTPTGTTVRGRRFIDDYMFFSIGEIHTGRPLRIDVNTSYAGMGWFRYEYQIANLRDDYGVQSLRVKMPVGVPVTNVRFVGPAHHSGEPYSETPWTVTQGADFLEWATEPYAVNPNANALRWGTMFSFRVDVRAPPRKEFFFVTPFKPGAPGPTSFLSLVPGYRSPCAGDTNEDYRTDAADLSVLLSNFGTIGPNPGPSPVAGDVNFDDRCDAADLSVLLGNFGCTN